MGRKINVTIACSLGYHNTCLGIRYGKGYPMSGKQLGPCECEHSGHPHAHEKEVKHGKTRTEGPGTARFGRGA